MTNRAKRLKSLPSEPPKVRIFSMDGDKERTLELHEIIGDVLRKSKEVILVGDDILIVPQSILTYRARALLFMYAHTYFLIVQSVTNTFIGWVDLELNMYYQMIVDDIKELLASNECKDFPGEFKPFNESIFPETGILKIGWRGFAPDCADFLSKAQQYFHDMPKPANSELDYEYISQKFSVIKDKAHEYASKAKRLCDEHNKKETTPPKESIIHKHKKPMEAGQENEDVLQLTKAERLAYQSYYYAITQKPELADTKDDETYDWLKENGPPDYELPSCETWKRQVRAGRKRHGTQKNTLRAGRSGHSIAQSGQLRSLSEISSQYTNEAD